MTAGVVGSFVVAIIALGIGIAALKEAEDNDTSVTAISGPVTTVRPQTNEITEEAGLPNGDQPLPGSKNYDGYHPISENRFTQHLDVIVHSHLSRQHSARLQKGIDDAARLFKYL